MKVYLIRHGQTDFNLQGIVQGGGVDSSLNDTGRSQASAFFEAYRHMTFDAWYASGQRRTAETLAPWETSFSVPVKKDARINELGWGWMEGKKPDAAMREEFLEIRDRWRAGDLDAKIDGGESANEVWSRSRAFFQDLFQRHMDERILICSHGRTSRIILSGLLGYGLTHMEDFGHSNTGLNILNFLPNGTITAELLNDTQHLTPLI